MSSSCFFSDFAGIEEALQDQLTTKRLMPTRIWVKPGYEFEIVFLDDVGVSFYEHGIWVGEKRTWETCPAPMGQRCPLCEAGNKRVYSTVFSVVRPIEEVECGQVYYKNKLRLFTALPDVACVLKRLKHKYGTLVGHKFRIYKTDYAGLTQAKDFEFIEVVDLKMLNSPWPYDYQSIFAPKTPERLEEILKGANS